MSKPWIFNGKLVVNNAGQPILCNVCPCKPTTCQECVGMGLWGLLIRTEWSWNPNLEEWVFAGASIVGDDPESVFPKPGCFLWDRPLGYYIDMPDGPNDKTLRDLYYPSTEYGCNLSTILLAEWVYTYDFPPSDPFDRTFRLFISVSQADPITNICLEPNVCYTPPDGPPA